MAFVGRDRIEGALDATRQLATIHAFAPEQMRASACAEQQRKQALIAAKRAAGEYPRGNPLKHFVYER